ncbi:Ankyrin repeat protein 2 [Giardia muris]|uniref:Ankyrin repeat protein 2 n=1 Tax=Giardia muris TaxID=5742 RepID=A0A4Z1T5H5_GIAMU|nr:Ankyrin repeat protein 2 [Giardia muris]|eukprot:TNJ28377.1 Ankyrin repeat protein 2 [Giardia muris]
MPETALIVAAAHGDAHAVRKNIGEARKKYRGLTALMYATKRGHIECVRILARHEAKLLSDNHHSALHLAAQYGYATIVELLTPLEAGIRSQEGWTALMYAVANGNLECIKHLLAPEARIQDKDGRTALMHAISRNRVGCAQELLCEAGIQANNGLTALMLASRYNMQTLIELLLPYERELRDSDGHSASWYALANIEKSSSQTTWKSSQDQDQDQDGTLKSSLTSLSKKHLATGLENVEKDCTKLMVAAKQGDIEQVRILKEQELRLQTQDGWTALMFAAQYGHIGCVKLLLDEADLENSQGETALDVAELACGSQEFIKRCIRCARIIREHTSSQKRSLITHLDNALTDLIRARAALETFSPTGLVHEVDCDISSFISTLEALQRKAVQLTESKATTSHNQFANLLVESQQKITALTEELEQQRRELQELTRMPPEIQSANEYTPGELNTLRETLSASLRTVTTAQAVFRANVCIICHSATKSILFQPCTHLCACEECGKDLPGKPCPICKTIISSVRKVYL